MSIAKTLEKRLGGKWVYCRGGACWSCNDGRVIRRCCPVDEFDNPGLPEYWLYERGKAPERAEKFIVVKKYMVLFGCIPKEVEA